MTRWYAVGPHLLPLLHLELVLPNVQLLRRPGLPPPQRLGLLLELRVRQHRLSV